MPLLTIETDKSALLSALDALADRIAARLLPIAAITANRIANDATRRVRRKTGLTAQGITVRLDEERLGYVVESLRQQFPNLPIWLDFGTKNMQAFPYMVISADLERGAHERRVLLAIQEEIDAAGLGES